MMINGSEPMIAAEDLASWLMDLIFAFIFLRSRSTLDRLPKASERLPPVFDLNCHNNRKKVDFRQRHPLNHALNALIDGNAYALALDNFIEFRANWRAGFRCNDLHRVGDWKARLKSADHHVNGIGKIVQKDILPAGAQELDKPPRQAKKTDNSGAHRNIPRQCENKRHDGHDNAQDYRQHPEHANGEVNAGLRDKGAQIELLLALLFALAKLVQRVLNLFSPRILLVFHQAGAERLPGRRLGCRGDRLDPL